MKKIMVVLLISIFGMICFLGGSLYSNFLIMNYISNSLLAIITTAATASMALFTFALWRINKRQHSLDYEQELRIHQCRPTFCVVESKEGEERDATIETQLVCVLVNSSALPLVIKKIEVYFKSKEGKVQHFAEGYIHDIATTEHIYLESAFPKESPPGIFIKSVPWVISGKSFVIFSYKYTSIPKEYQGGKVLIEFTYYNEYKKQEITEKVEDKLPTDLFEDYFKRTI